MMQHESPFTALAEAVGAACYRDLPDIRYETKDYKTQQMVKRSRRPLIGGDVEVSMFEETWGSTALGYGGIGGSAMTNAYTVIVTCYPYHCVYFGCGRLAYRINIDDATPEQASAWAEMWASRHFKAVREALTIFAGCITVDDIYIQIRSFKLSLTVVLETAGADASNPEFRVAQVDSLDSIFGNPNVDGGGNVVWSPNAAAVSTAFQASKVYSLQEHGQRPKRLID